MTHLPNYLPTWSNAGGVILLPLLVASFLLALWIWGAGR